MTKHWLGSMGVLALAGHARNTGWVVPDWVESGAVLDLDFANERGYNSRNRMNDTPDSILTYTSPSPKMVYGDDGVLRYAPHNLCTNSQDFTAWTKLSTTVVADQAVAPDGTLTADLVYPSGSGSARQVRVQLNQTAGVNAIIRVRAKYAGIRWLSFGNPRANAEADVASFDLVNGVVGTVGAHVVSTSMVDLGDGWYECTVVGPCDGTDYVLFLLRDAGNGVDGVTANGTDGIYLWGAELKLFPVHDSAYIPTTSAAVYSLPIDHDPVTFDPLGVLIEEQRTNLLTYSEQFDNAAWVKARSSVSANAVAAPDGTTTADKLVEDTTAANNHNISGAYTGWTSGSAYTFTLYLKAAERSRVLLQFPASAFPASVEAEFNLATGAIVSTGAGLTSATITDVGNSWYRCRMTATADATTSGSVVAYMNNGVSASYDGDGTSGLYLWGTQLEAGAFPTSYIPTVASQVTRAADQVSTLTSAFGYNSLAGTVVVELDTVFRPAATVRSSTYWYTDASNNIHQYTYPNRGGLSVVSGGVSQGDVTAGSGLIDLAPFKMASAWAPNDLANVANGGTVNTDVSATLPAAATIMYVGGRGISVLQLCGHIKRLTYFPTRKSNAELQALTA